MSWGPGGCQVQATGMNDPTGQVRRLLLKSGHGRTPSGTHLVPPEVDIRVKPPPPPAAKENNTPWRHGNPPPPCVSTAWSKHGDPSGRRFPDFQCACASGRRYKENLVNIPRYGRRLIPQ